LAAEAAAEAAAAATVAQKAAEAAAEAEALEAEKAAAWEAEASRDRGDATAEEKEMKQEVNPCVFQGEGGDMEEVLDMLPPPEATAGDAVKVEHATPLTSSALAAREAAAAAHVAHEKAQEAASICAAALARESEMREVAAKRAHQTGGEKTPPPIVLAPEPGLTPVLGTWLDIHGHGRVIGNVKKLLLSAHVTLVLPTSMKPLGTSSGHTGGEAWGDWEGGGDAAQPSSPLVPPENMRAHYYPPSIARILSSSSIARSLATGVRFIHTSRWLLNLEHNKKLASVMGKVAAVEASRGFLLDLDLGTAGKEAERGSEAIGALKTELALKSLAAKAAKESKRLEKKLKREEDKQERIKKRASKKALDLLRGEAKVFNEEGEEEELEEEEEEEEEEDEEEDEEEEEEEEDDEEILEDEAEEEFREDGAYTSNGGVQKVAVKAPPQSKTNKRGVEDSNGTSKAGNPEKRPRKQHSAPEIVGNVEGVDPIETDASKTKSGTIEPVVEVLGRRMRKKRGRGMAEGEVDALHPLLGSSEGSQGGEGVGTTTKQVVIPPGFSTACAPGPQQTLTRAGAKAERRKAIRNLLDSTEQTPQVSTSTSSATEPTVLLPPFVLSTHYDPSDSSTFGAQLIITRALTAIHASRTAATAKAAADFACQASEDTPLEIMGGFDEAAGRESFRTYFQADEGWGAADSGDDGKGTRIGGFHAGMLEKLQEALGGQTTSSNPQDSSQAGRPTWFLDRREWCLRK